MWNVQVTLFGVFALALIFTNELMPRMMRVRLGREFAAYAVKNLRPWVYAISFGAFCAVASFGNAGNAWVTATLIVLAAYIVAGRAYMAR